MATALWASGLAILMAVTGCNSSTVTNAGVVGAKHPSAGRRAVAPTAESASPKLTESNVSAAGMCSPKEKVIFQCQRHGEAMAVCGQKTQQGTSLVRFSLGKLFNIRKNGIESANFSWADRGYAGGGEIQIRMNIGNTSLVAYSRIVRTNFNDEGDHDAQDEAGMVELVGNRMSSIIECDNPDDAMRYKADPAEFMPKGNLVTLNQ